MRNRASLTRSRTAYSPAQTFSGYSVSELQRECIQAFLAFLEERRALYAPGAHLKESDAKISAQKIVEECAWCLKELKAQPPGSMLIEELPERAAISQTRANFQAVRNST
jgi:hypothetical protein